MESVSDEKTSLKRYCNLETLRRLLFILSGDILCALAVNLFFIPNNLLTGGVGGISILVQYLTSIPTGIVVFLINIPIFILGFKKIDRDFAIFGFISMAMFSAVLTITRDLNQVFAVKDIFLGAVFGGLINGLGMGILFRNRSSQGGFDIPAVILKRKYDVNIGTALMGINCIIIFISSFIFGYKSGMYTILSMYIGYNVLDKVQMGLNIRKKVIIVSEKPELIANEIISNLNRGVTFLEGKGAYTNENKQIIYCVVTSREVAKIKRLINQVDPHAFLTINDVVEVMGKGFRDINI